MKRPEFSCFTATTGRAVGWLLFAVWLAGCDGGTVERRAVAIRARNAQNDRESSTMSAARVREQWFVRDGQWFGKLGDGSLVRLDSPVISSAPIKQGRPYCCKWLGEVTVAAARWRSQPARDTSQPYCLTYTVLVRDSSRIEVAEVTGVMVVPPSPGEIAAFAACP